MDKASVIALTNGALILTYDDLTGYYKGTGTLEITGLELVQELIVSKDMLTDRVVKRAYGEDIPRDDYSKCAQRLIIPQNHIAFIRQNP